MLTTLTRRLVGDLAELAKDPLGIFTAKSLLPETPLRLYPPVWMFERRALGPDRHGAYRATVMAASGGSGTVRPS